MENSSSNALTTTYTGGVYQIINGMRQSAGLIHLKALNAGTRLFFCRGFIRPLCQGGTRCGLCCLLDFGLRSTFDAADAARLLVTSLFAGRLAICFLTLVLRDAMSELKGGGIYKYNKCNCR